MMSRRKRDRTRTDRLTWAIWAAGAAEVSATGSRPITSDEAAGLEGEAGSERRASGTLTAVPQNGQTNVSSVPSA